MEDQRRGVGREVRKVQERERKSEISREGGRRLIRLWIMQNKERRKSRREDRGEGTAG